MLGAVAKVQGALNRFGQLTDALLAAEAALVARGFTAPTEIELPCGTLLRFGKLKGVWGLLFDREDAAPPERINSATGLERVEAAHALGELLEACEVAQVEQATGVDEAITAALGFAESLRVR